MLLSPFLYRVYIFIKPELNLDKISLIKNINSENQDDFTSVKENNSNEPIQPEDKLFEGEFNEASAPDRIVIPSVSIDILVKPAKVIEGKWEVFEDSAAFGIGSSLPGDIGNSVVFAHAREGAFLPLRKIKLDERIYLLVNDKVFIYKVTEIREVLPTDINVIANSDSEILTLYTCSGFADTKRLIVISERIIE